MSHVFLCCLTDKVGKTVGIKGDMDMANLHNRKLSASFIKTAPVGRHTDSHGLMLVVQRSGSRSWIQRIVIHGKRRDMGLGGWPMVSLSEAREKAFANRKRAREGGDPREHHQSIVSSFKASRWLVGANCRQFEGDG